VSGMGLKLSYPIFIRSPMMLPARCRARWPGLGSHGSHPEVQEQTAARGGSLAVKLNAHVAPVVAGHTRH